MSNIIIVEGCDGSGKSTLINDIIKPEGFDVIHNGVYVTPFIAYDTYANQIAGIKGDTVFDRMHISQSIYGPIMRDEDSHPKMHNFIEERLNFQQTVVILCHTTESLRNWKSRKGMEYLQDEDKYLRVWNEYHPDNFDKYTALPFVVYDYTNEAANELTPIMNRVEIIRENYYT